MTQSILAHKINQLAIWLFILLTLLTTRALAMQIEEPEYFLKLDIHDFPRKIAINGNLIERDQSGKGSSASQFPINHWIKNGQNIIELHYGPDNFIKKRTSKYSKCNVSIWVKGKVDGKKVHYKVTDIDYVPNYDIPLEERYNKSLPAGDYKYSDETPTSTSNQSDFSTGAVQADSDKFDQRGNRLFRTFTADVPFPEWAFFSGDQIFEYPMTKEKYAEMKTQTWPLLEELWDFFESKKIDIILPLFELRSKELDIAYYREPGESLASFKHDLENAYNSKLPLDRVDNDNMQLVVAFNGRLFTLANAANLAGTVMFYDKDDNTHTFFNIYWMKKDGKWIIAR